MGMQYFRGYTKYPVTHNYTGKSQLKQKDLCLPNSEPQPPVEPLKLGWFTTDVLSSLQF